MLPLRYLVYNKHVLLNSALSSVPRAWAHRQEEMGRASPKVMEIKYKPRGVCSQAIRLDLEDGVVHNVKFTGGCSGNAQGLCRLVEGMPAEEVVKRLRGIRCGFKPTSCPDQLAAALEQALAEKNSGGQ